SLHLRDELVAFHSYIVDRHRTAAAIQKPDGQLSIRVAHVDPVHAIAVWRRAGEIPAAEQRLLVRTDSNRQQREEHDDEDVALAHGGNYTHRRARGRGP